ncbi:hypothetical protein SAICODRAFT_30152 [Saitoella complicata NRRL Y-17804]|uniref:uncharacterized protein n=1 Tax=Saitoella complicata (strain BCRC 22490 / CBS 7301 / JCM 7358 / NBRC 10748 / NRRL Y-17804) TaxID=698492 RepID=UPI000866CE18|nr:uncharacterized protein SAICODRAFT_30152 [Saitoella complicata NRRL Y-17804]ODQ53468.1 hypothetical protein SAICODRAFT_30152 [Saitoella complicata NRRL Y-17804]
MGSKICSDKEYNAAKILSSALARTVIPIVCVSSDWVSGCCIVFVVVVLNGR